MDRKRLAWAVVALGVALAALSALADPLAIGEGGGIGYKQVTGMVVGGVLVAAGVVLLVLARRAAGSQPTEL